MENKFLIFIVVVLGVLALIQLVKVYEMTSKIRDDKTQENITPGENLSQASLFLVFMVALFGGTIYLMLEYGNGGLGSAASEHGVMIDDLLVFNWWIVLPVFFIMNGMLFIFAFLYRRDPERKPVYLVHNNKLEMIWTIVPAIILAAVIIYGLKTWNFIMNPEDEGTIIELYAKQFDWTARYSGEDNKLGKSNFKLVTGTNPLGVITTDGFSESYQKIDAEIDRLDSVLLANSIEKYVENVKTTEYLLPDGKVAEMSEKIERLKRQKYRIKSGLEIGRNADADDAMAANDVIVKGEMHLIVDKTYTFYFRSQDVLHCAWFPHFRAQMNCVPGMTTSFTLKPTITTKNMRLDEFVIDHYKNINNIHNERKRRIGEEEEVIDFDYILMCNKICGANHSNMQMKVIVETEAEYKNWIESQTRFDGGAVSYTAEAVAAEEVTQEIEE
jgi:cytochrome c oxidase subunit II